MPSDRADPEGRPRYAGLPEEAVAGIAALFDAEPARAAFSEGLNDPVWEITHRGPNGNLELTLWPALSRVDATCGPHAWIVRGIEETEILPGIEVIFRFGNGGILTAATTGQVLMVTERPGS